MPDPEGDVGEAFFFNDIGFMQGYYQIDQFYCTARKINCIEGTNTKKKSIYVQQTNRQMCKKLSDCAEAGISRFFQNINAIQEKYPECYEFTGEI